MKTAKINGIESNAARIAAEMTNATGCRTATMTAYILRSSPCHWMDRMEMVDVTIDLRPGYSRTDHLFDRLAAKVIERVHGKLFASEAEIHKAANSAPRPECAYTVTLDPCLSHEAVPADLEEAAEEIRQAILTKENKSKYAKRRKEFAALALTPVQRGESWVIVGKTKPYSDDRYAYQINIQKGNDFVGLCCPGPRFESETEASEKIEAYKSAIGL